MRAVDPAPHESLTGAVQGVFFRDSTRREAERRRHRLGPNRPDGTVEAVFEGEPTRSSG